MSTTSNSSKSLKNYKTSRDVYATELLKQTRYLDKWQSISEKNLGQEQHLMRKQLERLESDKRKYSKSRLSVSDDEGFDNTSISTHSRFYDNQSPGTYKYDERYAKRLQTRLQQDQLTRPRSHRQLKEDYTTPTPTPTHGERDRRGSREQTPKLPDISGTLRIDEPSKAHRRKSMPAGYTSGPPVIIVTGEDRRSSFPSVSTHTSHEDVRKSRDSLMPKAADSPHHSRAHLGSETDEQLSSLYEMAIQTVASADDSAFGPVQEVRRRSSLVADKNDKVPDTKQMDLAALKELESLLKEARHFNVRRQRESDYGLHTATCKGQKRRLHFLEEILQALNDNKKTKFNPYEMLQCGYLRLSKTNIETLEGLLRDMGFDPGIHAHSDVSNYNLWDDVHRERELEAKKSQRSTSRSVKLPSESPTKHKRF